MITCSFGGWDHEYDGFVAFACETPLSQADHEEELHYERVDDETGAEMATAALRRDPKKIKRRINILEGTEQYVAQLKLHELAGELADQFVRRSNRQSFRTGLPFPR